MAYLDYAGLQRYHNGLKQYIQSYVENAIQDLMNTVYYVCQTGEYDTESFLPTIEGEPGIIYLVPKSLEDAGLSENSIVGTAIVGTATVIAVKNIYYEYIYNNGNFELIGDVKVDLSNYLKYEDIATNNDITNMLNELSL